MGKRCPKRLRSNSVVKRWPSLVARRRRSVVQLCPSVALLRPLKAVALLYLVLANGASVRLPRLPRLAALALPHPTRTVHHHPVGSKLPVALPWIGATRAVATVGVSRPLHKRSCLQVAPASMCPVI